MILLLVGLCCALQSKAQQTDADRLYSQALSLAEKNDYANALPLYLQANDAYVKEGRTNTAEYAKCLHNTGIAYASTNNLSEGAAYTKRALDLREKLLGKVSEDYICSLNNYAQMLSGLDKDEEAATLQEQVMELCDKLPSQHPLYGTFAFNMGRYYFILSKYLEAAIYLEKALPYMEKYGTYYEKILEWLAVCYIETDDREGIAHTMERTNDHNLHELEKDCDEPTCMKERAEYYAATGDNAKAKECYMTALSMNMTDAEKADVCYSYARFLATNNEDPVSSAEYLLLSAAARKAESGVTESYINTIYMAALSYSIGGCYDDAVKYFKEVVDYYSETDSDNAKEKTAQCHNGMGNALKAQKKYAEAQTEYRMVIDYYKQYDIDNKEYPKAIVSLANAEKFNGDYDSSIAHYKEALAIYEERGMAEEYDDTSNSLTLCYAYAGRTSELSGEQETAIEKAAEEARIRKLDGIIKEELEGLEIYHTYLGELAYANSLATIAGSYYLKEDYDNAVLYYRQYVDAMRKAVHDEFRLQSPKERMLLWNSQTENISELLDLLANLPEEKGELFPNMSAIAYDSQLLAKGILLNSAIEFEKVLRENGDKHLQEVYAQTTQNEAEIERLRTTASTDADLEKILELTRQNQTLQLELYKGCAEYADFTDYMSYKWQDVQAALRKEDVAVEFTQINTGPFDDSNYMVAIVLTKDSSTPIALPVCNLVVAKQMVNSSEAFTADFSFWFLLQDYLYGKKRLFFSADGVFNNVGIEYLPYEGKPLSERMEVYRLSSTKEICRNHIKPAIKSIAIFGGIDYDGLDGLSDATQRTFSEMTDDTRGQIGSNKLANLKNSLLEVQDIDAICRQKKIPNVVLLTETEASESAFRKLDYSSINLLHIATHGRYKAVSGASDAESMGNSVLAFAGANIGGDCTTQNDGIVTAADVAEMNLRQCDLAVLSACETGLGKLGDDGVFGLQRGFKNAGVQSLLMSLKPVSNAATTELMVSFYRHLMDGRSKRNALSLAQQELRSKGYTDSKYWATFILLDGID